jgi:hypothetical protein
MNLEETMAVLREKFSSQLDPKLLAKARKVAEAEGRQFQSILEEALEQYLERNQSERPRKHVLDAFAMSLDEFHDLYTELAK